MEHTFQTQKNPRSNKVAQVMRVLRPRHLQSQLHRIEKNQRDGAADAIHQLDDLLADLPKGR